MIKIQFVKSTEILSKMNFSHGIHNCKIDKATRIKFHSWNSFTLYTNNKNTLLTQIWKNSSKKSENCFNVHDNCHEIKSSY